MQTDIETLVCRAQDGDAEAFGRVYAATRGLVRGRIAIKLRRATGRAPEDLVEDLAADVFVSAWRSLGRYSNRGAKFEAWLTTIANNRVLDHLKSHRTRFEFLVPENEDGEIELDQPAPEVHQPDSRAVAKDEWARALAVLGQLTPTQREVLLRRYYLDQPVEDVATALGVKPESIKSMSLRGVKSARRLLDNA
jgi:RNA polymerase sigma-70 factor (ECF subfamily)